MEVRKIIVGTFASNCYVIADHEGGDGMVIDPGAEPYEILKAVRKLKATIRLIVLTHRHLDHVGAASKVKEETGAKLASHADCASWTEGEGSSRSHGGSSGSIRPSKLSRKRRSFLAFLARLASHSAFSRPFWSLDSALDQHLGQRWTSPASASQSGESGSRRVAHRSSCCSMPADSSTHPESFRPLRVSHS